MAGKQKGGVGARILFFGSPLLDVTARCDRDLLDRYGLKSDDCVRESAGHVALFRTLLDDPATRLTAGGSAQNSARVAKWILGDSGNVAIAGCVGNDSFAARMRRRMRAEGVEPLYVPLESESTGLCVCLLSRDGDRSMCARLGAAEHFSESHLAGEVGRWRSEADCVFVEGYYLAHAPEVVVALAKKDRETQVFAVSLSAEYICRDYADTFLEVLPSVDIVLSNEAEARTLARSMGLGHLSVEEFASILAKRHRPPNRRPRMVLVTRGPKPVLMARGNDSPLTFPVPSGVKVKDSVGCGDALAGAFLAKYVSSGDVREALKTGVLAAVEIAQVTGCDPPKKDPRLLGDDLVSATEVN